MTDTTVKIRAKGCASTGITDDLAAKMYAAKGSRHMAIIELKVDETHEKADGDRKVDLIITEVEPVIDGNLNGGLDEHVRGIQQALYRNRKLAADQELDFDGDAPERTVEDVLSSGAKFRPHPFLPVDAAEDNTICDVCGQLEAAGVHSTQDTLPDDEDDEEDSEPAGADLDEVCDYPGCTLGAGHDEDHDVAELDEDGRVVQFSGKANS